MKLSLLLVVLSSTLAFAEIHTMTLAQALARAAAENPDVLLARLETRSAQARVDQTNEPNSLKVSAGSGLATTYGFPMGVNGNAPSLFQVVAQRNIFDRTLHYRVEQSKENARGSEFDIRLKQQDAAYRVASAFLDAEAAARNAEAALAEVKNLEAVQKLVETRVAEGRELEIELKRARVNVATAQDEAEGFAHTQSNAEISMAQLLGYPAGDRVRPALEDRRVDAPGTQQQAVTNALADNAEVRRLESGIKARMMEVKSYQAMRLPKISLIAQYQALSTKLNNFERYYNAFQVNNAQIGGSFEIPLFPGKAMSAGIAMADTEIQKLQIQLDAAKRRIANDIDQAYRDLARAEKSRSVRLDSLDVARDDVRLALTLQTEGRSTMADVEAKRAEEQRAWRAYYEAQRLVDLARLNIQHATGTLLEAAR
jgi:outer membrane protein TolC